MEYATHRAMHEVPALWRFHAVHHSVERMDWMAGSRLHFLEPIVTRAVVLLPAFVLGASDTPLLCYIIWAGFQAGLVHSNFGFAFGPLKHVVATPLFHHWHHGSDKEAIDINYAAHTPLIDRLFGTYHMPTDRWPAHYGVAGDPLPKGMLRQFMYPFQRKAPPPPAGIGHRYRHVHVPSLARPRRRDARRHPASAPRRASCHSSRIALSIRSRPGWNRVVSPANVKRI